jgi:mono/diheme cytochrome c family protein
LRTFPAFLLGAFLVAGLWLVQDTRATASGAVRPALGGAAVLTGLEEPVEDFAFQAVDGRISVLSDLLARGPVAVVVRDAACPVSRRYGPTVAAMEDALAPIGVQFLYVNFAQQDAESVREAEIARFGFDGPYVLDRTGAIRRALDPRTTTEVFLIDQGGILRYRGAIDDQHGYAFARPVPRHSYLSQAARAVSRGESPPVAATFASGCYLHPEGPETADAPPPPTYSGRVKAIVDENCASCHRDGGIGPMALASYDDLVSHRDRIREMVNHDRMPPWPAGETRRWANDRRLSPDEKLALLDWLASGAPEGEPSRGLSGDSPRWPGGWLHGAPDAVLEMPTAFEIPADRQIGFRTFLIPTSFREDRWVSRVEILPSAPGAILHAVAVLADGPGEASEDEEIAETLEGFFAAWSPGYDGNRFPAGTAKRIPAGSWLKLHVQYVPTGETLVDRTRIGLHFTDPPTVGEVETRSAYTVGFEIPAGATHHAVSAEYRFPDDGRIVAFTPHMLDRGTAIRYVLWRPDGTQELLLDISRFYPAFRFSYVPESPIPVRAGSILQVTGWYDNSEANPRNPDPSRPVRAGVEPNQEILVGWFDFVPGPIPLTTRTLAAAGGG